MQIRISIFHAALVGRYLFTHKSEEDFPFSRELERDFPQFSLFYSRHYDSSVGSVALVASMKKLKKCKQRSVFPMVHCLFFTPISLFSHYNARNLFMEMSLSKIFYMRKTCGGKNVSDLNISCRMYRYLSKKSYCPPTIFTLTSLTFNHLVIKT